jgi:TetR/AcrR family transcriptional repressor of nem operon
MPRKKEFDEYEVLHRAMEIFWHKGYEATSVQDLVEQMGINRGSLYGTFTDKRALFLAAIQYYDQTIITSVVRVLHSPGSPRQAIEGYIRSVVEAAAQDQDRQGCFLTNSAVEVGPHDSEAEQKLQASLQRIEGAFLEALIAARQEGELGTRRDLRDVARFLTSSLQGLRVMARVNPDRDALMAVADIIISTLDSSVG